MQTIYSSNPQAVYNPIENYLNQQIEIAPSSLIKHKLATFLLSLLLLIYTFFSLIYDFYLVFAEKGEIVKLEKKCRK